MRERRPVFAYRSCVSCGICAQACPVSVLGMCREGKAGKYRNVFPELVKPGCLGCGQCARACPMDAIRMEEEEDES